MSSASRSQGLGKSHFQPNNLPLHPRRWRLRQIESGSFSDRRPQFLGAGWFISGSASPHLIRVLCPEGLRPSFTACHRGTRCLAPAGQACRAPRPEPPFSRLPRTRGQPGADPRGEQGRAAAKPAPGRQRGARLGRRRNGTDERSAGAAGAEPGTAFARAKAEAGPFGGRDRGNPETPGPHRGGSGDGGGSWRRCGSAFAADPAGSAAWGARRC